jgi:hypothetical protein
MFFIGKATFVLSIITMMLMSNVVIADFWSPRVSEETPPFTTYRPHLINAFNCSGRLCDNLRLNSRRNGSNHGANSWTSWFSEEGRNWRICPGRRYMTGVACRGRFCDNLSLQCTVIGNKRKTNCYWTPNFSEESGVLSLRDGYFAVGMRCSGRNCDNKSIYACTAR